MFSRLGFAVAVHVDSDIFLVDEVLAVGDKPFKKKCMEKMQEIRDEGRTLFYVSHAAGSVRKMCDRVLVLEKGDSASTARSTRASATSSTTRRTRPRKSTPTTSSAPTSDLRRPAARPPGGRNRSLADRLDLRGRGPVLVSST